MKDPFCTLLTPENTIKLEKDKYIIIEQDCILQKLSGWLAITKPVTNEVVTAQADGYFKAPVKITGGHKGGTFIFTFRT